MQIEMVVIPNIHKNGGDNFGGNFTKSQTIFTCFTTGEKSKFPTKCIQKFPPRLKYVAVYFACRMMMTQINHSSYVI